MLVVSSFCTVILHMYGLLITQYMKTLSLDAVTATSKRFADKAHASKAIPILVPANFSPT